MFDGDEMNIHMAQSIQARNELKRIANVQYQIVSVRDSSPIIGCQQDTLSGAYTLTEPDVKLWGWEVANILCNTTSETKMEIKMNKEYTGHEIFSHIIPVGINSTKKSGDKVTFQITNGKLTTGYLDKSSLSFAKNSIIHFIWDKFGPNKTRRFIDDSQRLVLNYLLMKGQSVGLKDTITDNDMGNKIKQIVNNKILKSKYDITQYENDIDQMNVDIIEASLGNELSVVQSEIGQMLMNYFKADNFFWTAAKSGAKGNIPNVAQISGIIGQNNLEGARIRKRIEGRSLIYFHRDDDTPEARGFINNSYLSGLRSYEFFINAAAGREGAIDTAIKSVTWETPIVIIENNKPLYTEIGKWIDNHLDNNKDKVNYQEDQNMEILDLPNGVYIPTTDYNGNVTWGEISAITRHDPGKQLYEIKTNGGRNVIVTESKSLLIWNNQTNQFKEVLTPGIKVGDYVPVTAELPEYLCDEITDNELLNMIFSPSYKIKDYITKCLEDKITFNTEIEINCFAMLCSRVGIYGTMHKNNNNYIFTQNNNYKIFNNVVLDPITEINLVNPEKYNKMYDLTIPSTFNFGLANGLQVRDTASTGYIQRKLIKGLEDLSIKYDGTNRNSRGIVIQLVYGENGINQATQTELQLNILSMNNKTLYDKLGLSDDQISKLEKSLKISKKELVDFNTKHHNKLCELRDELREIQFKSTLNYLVIEEKYMLPVNFFRITQDYTNKSKDKIDLSPFDVVDAVEDFLTKYNNRLITTLKQDDKFMKQDDRDLKFLLEVSINEYLAPSRCIFEYNLSKKDFNEMMKEIELSFIKAIIEPGEMVGILAAQSVGEQVSQMTLNTKHSAGSKSSANLGVSRIQELLHYSKNIKTPQMKVYFKEPYSTDRSGLNKIVSYFKHLSIRHLMASAEIYYDVGSNDSLSKLIKSDNVSGAFFINNQKADLSSLPFVFRISMDIEKMLDKETTLLDIKTKFISHWYKNYTNLKNLKKNEKDVISRISRCAILSNNITDKDQIIHIRFNMSSFNYNIITEFLRMVFDDITLKGIENIESIDVVQETVIKFDKENGDLNLSKEYVVYTNGINFSKLRSMKGIDMSKTKCNDIATTLRLYGIEATRQLLLYELAYTYKESGGNININHLSLLVDQMCHPGEIISIDRHGLSKIDIEPIARASFEKTMHHFINAAVFNEKDHLKSVSSRIAVGRVMPGGTGMFDLLLDTKKLENSEYTENEMGGRITFTPLEEEPLLQDIMKYGIGKTNFFIP